jgi:hypothetical protein
MIDITMILSVVVTIVSVLISALLIPVIKNRLGADNYDKLIQAVKIGVAAAEQLGKVYGWAGTDKKKYVVRWLQDKGFTMDLDEIDKLIEAMVQQLNSSVGLTIA